MRKDLRNMKKNVDKYEKKLREMSDEAEKKKKN